MPPRTGVYAFPSNGPDVSARQVCQTADLKCPDLRAKGLSAERVLVFYARTTATAGTVQQSVHA
eukprot:2334558-Alexandrium_andersonii.AAC.1